MHVRVQIVSVAFAVIVFVAIFEMVRRRRLRERYALVWMAAALTLLVLAIWNGLLTALSHAVGIYYPPSALFVIAFGFLLLLLLYLSAAVSRLSDQTTVLAQRVALLEQRRFAVQARDGDGSRLEQRTLTPGTDRHELTTGEREAARPAARQPPSRR